MIFVLYKNPIVLKTERIWRSEWGGNVFFAHGGHHARGVMALIRAGLDIKMVNSFTDGVGRILLLDTLIQDERFSLINIIYAPHTEESQVCFYSQLKKIMLQKVPTDNYVLLGGDFNNYSDGSEKISKNRCLQVAITTG